MPGASLQSATASEPATETLLVGHARDPSSPTFVTDTPPGQYLLAAHSVTAQVVPVYMQ